MEIQATVSMTHEQTHACHDGAHSDLRNAPGSRPRWLIPVLAAAGLTAVALVLLGVVSLPFAIYAGALAACGLMHVFGHGGHGDHR